jgi:hypothetical protein
MFGGAIGKLIVLVVVIYVTWKAFGAIVRLGASQRREVPRGKPGATTAARTGGTPSIEAEDLVKCPVCSSYVSTANPRSCGRSDCPQHG